MNKYRYVRSYRTRAMAVNIYIYDLPLAALQIVANNLPIYKVKMLEHLVNSGRSKFAQNQSASQLIRFNIPRQNMSTFLDIELAACLESCYYVDKSDYLAAGNAYIPNNKLSARESERTIRKLVAISQSAQLNEIIEMYNNKQSQPIARPRCSISVLINIIVNYYIKDNECIIGAEHSYRPFWYLKLFTFLNSVLINHLCIFPSDASFTLTSPRVSYYKTFLLKYARVVLATRIRPANELERLSALTAGGRLMIDYVQQYVAHCRDYSVDNIIFHHGKQIAPLVAAFGLMPIVLREFPREKLVIFICSLPADTRNSILAHYLLKKCGTYADYIF